MSMPIFEFQCEKCGAQTEEIFTTTGVSTPAHCGTKMKKIPSIVGNAMVTKGGNWFRFNGAHGPVEKGNNKPKTVGKGHGVGGSRPHLRPTFGGKEYA
jgi:putative FmdB family regulatory protein